MDRDVVVCLEGCHGAGKSAIVGAFEAAGFLVLDEGFMDAAPNLLHPQTLLNETRWVGAWFDRVLRRVQARREAGQPPAVFIADRSALSAVFYSRSHGQLLAPLIARYVEELRDGANVHVLTAHVTVRRDELWRRIQARLAREPHRLKLGEDSMDWMDRTLAFYHGQGWDATVDNDGAGAATVPGAAVRLLLALAGSPSLAGQPLVKQRLTQAAQHMYSTSQASTAAAAAAAPPATPLSPAAASSAAAAAAGELESSSPAAGFASPAAPAFRLSADGDVAPASPHGAAGVSPTQALSEDAAAALVAAYGLQLPSHAAGGAAVRAGGFAF